MRARTGGGSAAVALPPAPPSPPRHHSLRRLARYRLSHHLSSYRRQKSAAKTNDAPKAFDESDSLLSFPSTSTASAPNDRLNIPIEKLFEDAEHSMRLDLSRREPKEITQQLSLQFNLFDTLFIDLSANNLTDLPEFVGRLTRLRTIIAHHNCLASAALSAASLTYLDLNHNRICELPDPLINGLPRLQILLLAHNRLETLNPNVARWTATIEKLDLSSNLLTALPAELGALKNLRVLKVNDNRISELPKEIGEIQSLLSFDVSCNRLERLPSSLWRLAASTLSSVVLRVNGNPLTVPPLRVVRRGRRHVGKFLRELAIHDDGRNVNDFDSEFYCSHGIGETAQRPKECGNDAAPTYWHLPLSVNTQSAPTAFTGGGVVPIGGTDSGYASTVDENRLSHEFAMANGISEEGRHSIDRPNSISYRTNENRMPVIPQLDLSSIETSEAPINRVRKIDDKDNKTPMKVLLNTSKARKSVDYNNNYSHLDNNNNVNKSLNDKPENLKCNVNNTTTYTTSSAKITTGNVSGVISRATAVRNANLLTGLHSSHGSTSILSPLVERNECSWTNAVEEAVSSEDAAANSGSAVTTKLMVSTSNISKDSKNNASNSIVKPLKPIPTTTITSNDKAIRKLPTKSIVAPASATLPRKKISDTAQKNISAVQSTSNSSEDLTKLTGKSHTHTKNTNPLASSNSRLVRSMAIKPVTTNTTMKIMGNDVVKSSSTLASKTIKSTAMAVSSTVNSKAPTLAMSRSVAIKSQPADKTSNRIAPTTASTMSRSVVAPSVIAKPNGSTAPIKKPAGPATTTTALTMSARSARSGSTAPRAEKTTAQPLSQKSSSTLQLTRRDGVSSTSRLAAANAANNNLKRNN